MSEANQQHTPSRRAVIKGVTLAGAAAALGTVPAVAGTHDADAALLAAEAEWRRLKRETRAIEAQGWDLPYGPESKAREAALEALDMQCDAIAESMARMPASTFAGAVAKVRVAGTFLAAMYLPGSSAELDIEEQLVVSAAGDFERLAQGGVS